MSNTTTATRREFPALFSTPEVQGILAGRKTRFSRPVKPQPIRDDKHKHWHFKAPKGTGADYAFSRNLERSPLLWVQCPHGKDGDIIWVREKWGYFQDDPKNPLKLRAEIPDVDAGYFRWRPASTMPKAAARIYLLNEGVRVQRLGNITEEDAIAEGLYERKLRDGNYYHWDQNAPSRKWFLFAADCFAALWQSINGPDSWNPDLWIWAISFRVLSTTGKPLEI